MYRVLSAGGGGGGVAGGAGVGTGVAVGAGVGTGVGVAADVGTGVAVGVGVTVGLGVGAGVAGEVGAAVGVGVGVGVGRGVGGGDAASVRLKTVEAIRPLSSAVTDLLAAVTAIGTAPSACGPLAPAGTRIVALNAPRPFTFVEGSPVAAPSQISWIRILTGKLRPTTATEVPVAPLDGAVEMVAVVALVPANGNAKAMTTRIIVSVATQSRHGVGFDDRPGATSGTQRVPSQKDMRWLHSATRLTR
jgi:hypothetical protein